MWSKPRKQPGVGNAHGGGAGAIEFGPDVTEHFLRANGLNYIIRSLTVPQNLKGYSTTHKKKMWTLFRCAAGWMHVLEVSEGTSEEATRIGALRWSLFLRCLDVFDTSAQVIVWMTFQQSGDCCAYTPGSCIPHTVGVPQRVKHIGPCVCLLSPGQKCTACGRMIKQRLACIGLLLRNAQQRTLLRYSPADGRGGGGLSAGPCFAATPELFVGNLGRGEGGPPVVRGEGGGEEWNSHPTADKCKHCAPEAPTPLSVDRPHTQPSLSICVSQNDRLVALTAMSHGSRSGSGGSNFRFI